jgi:hypothetical protein
MDVKVGDFYEYTGKTGFDLVQNNTYPIINIDKNNNIDIKTDNGHKIFSWEKFITVFEPVILNSCNSSIKAGDTVKCIKSLAYFDEGCTYTVLGVSSTGRIVIRDKFGNSKYVESYEFNTYFTTTFQVNDSSNELVESFKSITSKMAETYEKKNHDYGDSFDKSLDKFGLIASVVRMGDKMNRIESLINKSIQNPAYPSVSVKDVNLVKDESIKDTLLDLANYAIMTVMWMDNQKKCDNG